MDQKIRRMALWMVCFTLLCVCASLPVHAQGCSMSEVAGKWAFSSNGNVIGVGPRVSAGVYTLEASGNIRNGKATASLNGTVAPELFSGSYSVSPDCTGVFVAHVTDPSGNPLFTSTLAIYFDDRGQEMRAVFTSVVKADGITQLETAIVLEGRKISEE